MRASFYDGRGRDRSARRAFRCKSRYMRGEGLGWGDAPLSRAAPPSSSPPPPAQSYYASVTSNRKLQVSGGASSVEKRQQA